MHALTAVCQNVFLKICMQFNTTSRCTCCYRIMMIINCKDLTELRETGKGCQHCYHECMWSECMWSSVQCETDCSLWQVQQYFIEETDFARFFVNVLMCFLYRMYNRTVLSNDCVVFYDCLFERCFRCMCVCCNNEKYNITNCNILMCIINQQRKQCF